MVSQVVTLEVPLGELERDFARADIEFREVDHAGPSFEARVFLNNAHASATTPCTSDEGYAGAFHIFGHGGCFGEVGHCEVQGRRRYDPRPEHPLTPARKVLMATDSLKRAMEQTNWITVTVVAVITSLTEKTETSEFLHFAAVRVLTYR
jgi:hypothetical protein